MKKVSAVREFRLPLLNFGAKHYSKLAPIKLRSMKVKNIPLGYLEDLPKIPVFPVYIPNYKGPLQEDEVYMPPLFNLASSLKFEDIKSTPLRFKIENHTQSVEHGVALTSQCVKKKRTEASRLHCALNTDTARKQFPNPVTHKAYRERMENAASASDASGE